MTVTAGTDGTTPSGPLLSVVVTIVDGGDAVRAVLSALEVQRDPPPMEVLVPYDASVDGVPAWQAEFPSVRFLSMGAIATVRDIRSAAGQHELYDRRRSVALAAARGDLVAIIEDRGLPRRDWARTAVLLHGLSDCAAIGGAIEPASSGLVGWALYVCDFSRYGLPFARGPRAWVSDVNIVYKRRAVESTRTLWAERYQEPVVHWDLMRRGEELHLAPELVVDHRRRAAPLTATLAERFHWGRLFGHIRVRQVSGLRRVVLIAAAPLIPLVILARHGAAQAQRGRAFRFLAAVPALATLLVAWSAGEVWGYITGEP